MSLGEDIKTDVYEELGALAQIVSRDPIIKGERLLYEINTQTTKPFVREHHLDASLPYDTQAVTGDVFYIENTYSHYLVMNNTPEMFEGEVIEYSTVLYLCNIPDTSVLLRPSESRNEETYDMEAGWSVVSSPIYGVLEDRQYGSSIEQDSPTGQFSIWSINLIIPKTFDIKPLDRVYISDFEYYKVEIVGAYTYPGANIALLVEDTRPFVSLEEEY